MKYFGEFLVNKGLISSQDLVKAFLEQIMRLPPLPKLIYDQNLLTSDQILQVFIVQQDKEIDFTSACKHLGFWTEDFHAKIEHACEGYRIPFGQILLQNGVLDVKILVKNFDEFLSQADVPINKMAKSIPLPTLQNNLIFKSEVLSASAREVCDFYTANKKDELHNLLILTQQNITIKDLANDFLQDLLKNIHTLKGVARFSKAEIVDYICNSIETMLTTYLQSAFCGNEEAGEQLCILLGQGLSLLLDVRNAIATNSSEADFWNNLANRNKLDAWVSEILKLNNLLKGVVNEAQSAMR